MEVWVKGSEERLGTRFLFLIFPTHTVRVFPGAPRGSQKVSSWPEEKIQVSVGPTTVLAFPHFLMVDQNVYSSLTFQKGTNLLKYG